MNGGQETDTGVRATRGDGDSIGARLAAARERRQMTPDAVARQLRLDVAIINALEADDSQHLPAPIFVQGYLRSYARLLGLPEDELVDDYGRENGDLPPLNVSRVPDSKPLFRLPSMRLLRNVVFAIIALSLLWLAFPYLEKIPGLQKQAEQVELPGRLEIPPVER